MSKIEEQLISRINELQIEITALRPYNGNMLSQIRQYYRVGLTWTSNAIEGSSYTESETKILLEDGITVGGKTLKDTFAALGHAQAYDYMFSLLKNKGITEKYVLTMHGMMKGGLETDEVGVYRTHAVFVTGSTFKFPSAGEIPCLMQEMFADTIPRMANLHPVVQAAKIHACLVAVHPFGDGNGRTARLAMNTILIQNGFLPVQIHPVIRNQYIEALRTAQSTGNSSEFVELILQQEIESQKEILRLVGQTQKTKYRNMAVEPKYREERSKMGF
ncbi:MAG: Fic family protein [Desulfovibrio sp.]|nr:Fic family protein [Desulfovibrio sp.]